MLAFYFVDDVIILVFRQGVADTFGAVVLGRIKHHPSPAATDIQQFLARFQLQLAANVVVFVILRGFQTIVLVFKIGARIGHGRIEP